ncbi:putative ATP-dependent RNA helicase DHX57 [Patella vulgata]|uniref:putative ATP-dependent RNA helicase DHX57 n=1 Tax=Patella vulgata TaxID=6465 RepID=UPI0024A8C359|nr:putative ATP-dependent RNA helicase DHX57 [Patella vulgata]
MRRNRPNSSTGKHHGGGGFVDYDDGDFAFMPAGPKPKKPGNKGQARGGFRGRGRGDRGRGGSDRGRGGSDRGRGGSDRGRGGSDRGRGADRGRGGGRGNDRGRGGNEGNRYGGSSSNDFSSSRGKGGDSRVQMQHLYMSNENQDMVRDVLFAIRRGDYETIDSFGDDDQNGKDDDVYGDQDYELEDEEDDDDEEEDESYYNNRHDDKQYWVTDKNLVIEDTTSYAEMDAEEIPKLQYKTMNNQFAIQRLMRCGFHKSRCQDALQLYNDDIGAALDFLLCECFDLEYNPSQSGEQLTQEILDARSEEMMVLQGIFDDRFEERLSNKIWILNLELPHLAELSKPTFELKSHSRGSKVKVDTDKRPLCKYFSSKVGCRFGSKCKFKHALKENPNTVEAIAEPLREAESPKCPFQLEIRFINGNKYPEEPPLVIFSSILDYFPQHGALNISQYLFHEAKSLSEFHSPVVFSIASLLEEDNTGTLIEILQRPPSACSLPKPIISMKQFQAREETNEKMERVSIPQIKPDDDKMIENGKAAMLRMVDRDEERFSQNKKKSDNDPKPSEKYGRKNTRMASQIENSPFNKRLKDDFVRKLDSKGYKDRQTSRSGLPAWDMKEEILKTLEDNQVTVISGMTGCGKTTQVPQFILESYLSSGKNKMCNIICTQPRRISAIAVAQRVAQEQVDKIGKLVGYQIRLENIQSASTRLLFCTTGIILRRLEGDPMLHGVSHLIIDEVHERTEESDFLMMILRDLLVTRTDLKVILMSATLNADLFSRYFGCCPTVEIPGL